ncbi:hypothetical protein [uncultured Clostridium sp.]|uniref:hypothetical protein n=1 Tax=uncultured Clostridium sp. TaxID=59620 RepID=UPI0025D06493|nr:hypothetical protein [uncultured Clostridium sp.]
MINIKIDMLQIKRDRVTEIKKQILINVKKKYWTKVYELRTEQRQLESEIKHMEEIRFGR